MVSGFGTGRVRGRGRFGFRVSGSGIRVSGVGYIMLGLPSEGAVAGGDEVAVVELWSGIRFSGFRVSGSGFRMSGIGYRGYCLGSWVSSFRIFGFGISGIGIQISGIGYGVIAWCLDFQVAGFGFRTGRGKSPGKRADVRPEASPVELMSGPDFRVSIFEFRVCNFGYMIPGFGVSCRARERLWADMRPLSCSPPRVSVFGFRVSGFGFRVSGFLLGGWFWV